jgi:hypothetical protein
MITAYINKKLSVSLCVFVRRFTVIIHKQKRKTEERERQRRWIAADHKHNDKQLWKVLTYQSLGAHLSKSGSMTHENLL